jgi:hypothetical protein
MECEDEAGLIDSKEPILHGLPSANIATARSIIPPAAEVHATDNEPCFEATVDFVEWTNIKPPACSARTVRRTWTASDPQGDTASFVQTINQARG